MATFEVYQLVEEKGRFIVRQYHKMVGTVNARNAMEAIRGFSGNVYAILKV
jgi:hypothetical protein